MRQIDAFMGAAVALIALVLIFRPGATDNLKAIGASAAGIIGTLQGGKGKGNVR